MPLCSACQRLTPAGAHHCPSCGAAQRPQDVVAQAEHSSRIRDRERPLRYALTCVLVMLIVQVVFRLPQSLSSITLRSIAFQALLLGTPLGWLVSVAGGGLMTGAAIGAGFGVVLAIIVGIFGDASLQSAAVLGISSGLLPGAIMGWHMEQDT